MVLVGGERQLFFPAGTVVPAIEANANTNGWYSLSVTEMNAILNP